CGRETSNIASNRKMRGDWPSFAGALTQLEPTTNRICVRTRSRSVSGFLRATLCCSTSRSARSISLITRQILGHALHLPTENWHAERLPYNSQRSMLLRFCRRRWFVAKFAVTDFSARICDVAARAQRSRSEQYHRDREWNGRFRPAQRNEDRSDA